MRNLAVITLTLAASLSFSGASVAQAEDIPADIQGPILDATVKILIGTVDNPSDIKSAGSGVLIANESHVDLERGVSRRLIISTAAHVVEPMPHGIQTEDGFEIVDIQAITLVNYTRDASGQIRDRQHFTLSKNIQVKNFQIKRFPEVDAAYLIIDLKASSNYLRKVKPVKVAGVSDANTLPVGSDLYISGCPIVMDPVIFRNRLLQRNMTNLSFRQFDFLGHLVSRVLTGGNSGGGVFNSKGELIGIVTLRIGNDFGAFTGIEHVVRFAINDSDVMPIFLP